MAPNGRHVFTSESVTEGHPDKIADQISDSILDAVLAEDRNGRVACETLVTTGLAFIAGEITTITYVDFPAIVRETIRELHSYEVPEVLAIPILDGDKDYLRWLGESLDR